MISSSLRLVVCLFALFSWTLGAHPLDKQRITKLERVYQQQLLEEETMDFIGKRYPDLGKDLQEIKGIMAKSIVGEGARGLTLTLSKLKGAEWQDYLREAKATALKSLDKPNYTHDQAVAFLEERRRMYEGYNHPYLGILLSCVPRYIVEPELEMTDEHLMPVLTAAMPKAALGLNVGFVVPMSWEMDPPMVEGVILSANAGPGAEQMIVRMTVAEFPPEVAKAKGDGERLDLISNQFLKLLREDPRMRLASQERVEMGGRKYLKYVVDLRVGDTPLVKNGSSRIVVFNAPVQGKFLSVSFVFSSYDGAPLSAAKLQERYQRLFTKVVESIQETGK